MWAPMMSYGYGGWGWMMALNGVVWIALIAGVFVLVFRLGRMAESGPRRSHASALTALEERYARGDIARDEFVQKRTDILGSDGPSPKRP